MIGMLMRQNPVPNPPRQSSGQASGVARVNRLSCRFVLALLLSVSSPAVHAGPPSGASRANPLQADLPSLPVPAQQFGGKADAKNINMEFKDAEIGDVVRIIAEASELNIVATNEAAVKRVTLYLHHVSARQALEIISKVGGLWYRHDPAVNVYRLMTTEEYQKDLVVFREEKTRIFQLLYPNPVSISTAIRDLYGDRVKYSQALSGNTLATLGGGSGSAGGQSGSSGQFSRDTSSTDGNFSRQTGSDFAGGQSQISGGGSGSGQSRRMLDEKLTVDQIDALEQRGGKKGEVSSEQLKGISRQEQDIFIVVVPDQNMVAVRTGDLEAMDNIARLIEQLDKPTSEVLLEMKVLDLTLGDSFHSVFDVKLEDGKTTFGLGNFAQLSGPTLVYQFLDDHIRANIELLSRENRVDVLATPLLMASNNRPAQLFIGEERVIVTGVDTDTVISVNGQTLTTVNPQTEVRNVGNTLRILPKINADRTITLSVQQDASSVLPKSTSLPISDGKGGISDFSIDSVNTANLNATVVAKDGMTVAIGGMIRTTISNDIQKVPLLGDIPYLGALFSRELRDKKKTELVLLITPHVMMAPTETSSVSSQVAKPLSDHPYFTDGDSAYEYHFDKLKPEGVGDRPWAQPPNPHVSRPQSKPRMPAEASKQTPEEPAVKQTYAELTRFAAKSVRQPVAPGEVPEAIGIRMETLVSGQTMPLLAEIGVDATPLQSWRKGEMYVTSVQLKNRLRLPVTVNHTRLHGRWLAATIEKSDLAGQGETGDATYLYVISSEPFHEALSR